MPEKAQKEEKVKELEAELSSTKKNKATNKHLGLLRAKIAKAKKEAQKSARSGAYGFFARKGGDATVVLVGFPSAGKSSLINVLTSADSKTAAYAFTTRSVIQGTLLFRDAHIQVLDLPGILEDAHAGYGMGSTVIGQVRETDLVLFVVDAAQSGNAKQLIEELRGAGIYINRKERDVRYSETTGPLRITVNRSGLPRDSVKEIFNGLGIYNGDAAIYDEVGEDELINIMLKRARYKRGILALNKIDMFEDYASMSEKLSKELGMEVVPISTLTRQNIDVLKDRIYANAGIIRVYIRPKESAQPSPITLRDPATVEQLARRIHTKMAERLKGALVTGKSTKFQNQKVGGKHILKDGDIVILVIEK